MDDFDLKILSYLDTNVSTNSIISSLGVIIGLISKLNQSKIFKKLTKLETQIKSYSVSNQIGRFRNNK